MQLFRSAALIFLAVGLVPASAGAALFTFDDFPAPFVRPLPAPDAPQTFLYQCGGKDHCTQADVARITFEDSFAVSTTRDGVTGTFSRQGSSWDIFPGDSVDKVISSGAGTRDFDLFLADFDHDLVSFEAAVKAPFAFSFTGVEAWVVIELWSAVGATGILVDSLVLAPGDPPEFGFTSVALDAPGGETFRSVRFGYVRSDRADCRVNCTVDDDPLPNSFVADDIRVTPAIPEPTAALCFGLGLLLATRARRR